MNRNLYIRIGLFLMALLPLSMSAQCVTRNVTNCKNYDPNQAIGAAMQGFFTDGSTGSFQFFSDATHPAATITECADGSATLTGTLAHFGNTDRRFRVNIQFVRRSCNLMPGAFQETTNLPPGTATTGWYYYEWGTASLVGEGQAAGAVLNLIQHMMPAQAGVNAHNQAPDVGKIGLTGWFEWQVVSQPSNNWLFIAPYANGIADFCFVMDGPPPTYCTGDPCATFPTPSVTTTNATNGQANGCINITNLPAGASSSINGGAATIDKTQYCGLAAGNYTITISKDGCTKSTTVIVGNTNTDPCITNPVPTPTTTVSNATNGAANGCINITNLPAGASSSINGGAATIDKTQYCGLAAGTYTITVNLNGCIKTVTVIVGNTNTDPCITNPVPTPTTTVSNATNGAANGCINITNLPAGASSSINGGAATVGKTQYCGLSAGTYTITVNLNGCIKTVTVTVGNTNTDPCITNPVPTPTTTVSNATNGAANGCINITNLPAGASSSINGGAATVGKVQYCGLIAGTYTITVNLNGCIKTVTVTVGNTNTDPCITNPVPTPTTTVSNATNGAANGCINITNLPAGASSSINGGAATVGKTQYCGLVPGTYTITVNLNGCTKSATVTVGNTVNCNVSGNTISKSCVNNVPVLTGSALANFEYVWLKSTSGCPNLTSQAIAGATGQNYTLPSRVTVTTYFVRCARPIGCTTWGTVNESNCITVYASDCAPPNCNVSGNTISKSCVNNVPVLTGSALANFEYVWLKSTSGCPSLTSQAIAGATGQNYTLPSLVTVTTYFVRCARPIGCTTWGTVNESNCITVYASDCAPVTNPCITFDPTKCYKIVNRLNGKCLDVSGWSQSNDAAINTWGYNNQANQQWKIQSVGSGYYKVMSRNSGKVLANHYTTNNSSCYQYDYYTGGAKDWSFTCNAEGYFTIKHRLSGRVLDLKDGGNSSTGDGCNTVIYTADGTNSQQWQIVQVNCASGQWSATATEIMTMDAHAELNRARIEWVNNTGYKNDFFTVEKMNNVSGNFEQMEIQNTIYSGAPEHYVAFDKNPTEGDNFYRVGVTYEDGTSKYSETKKVVFSSVSTIRVFPNPADEFIDVDLTQYKGSAASVYLYNSFGQQVQFLNIDKVGDGTTRLNVTTEGTGNYMLRVTAKGKRDVTKQIIISK